jgi:chorismate dehydratase
MIRRKKIRIGAVEYLNTKPLVYGLADIAPQAEIVFDLPSRLAERLAADDLDVALIPSIEYFQDPAYRIVSDACIACRGPVLSVKLFSRVPAERIRTLALDEGSRTSAALVQILLKEKFDTTPRLEPLPIGAKLGDTQADAVLLIGDRAIHSPPGQFAEVWDLGDEWVRWTKLPFVFAMWVAREDRELNGIEQALCESRDRGVANLEEIAVREAAAKGLTMPQCLSYLRDSLHFYLGPREREGLASFRELTANLASVSSQDSRSARRALLAASSGARASQFK